MTDKPAGFSFEIVPRPASIGGGYRLSLRSSGVEMRFSTHRASFCNDTGADLAWLDAFEEGSDWVASQSYLASGASASEMAHQNGKTGDFDRAGVCCTAACEEHRTPAQGSHPTKKQGGTPPFNKMGVTVSLGGFGSVTNAGGRHV